MGGLLIFYTSQRKVDLDMADAFRTYKVEIKSDLTKRLELYKREDASGDNFLGKYVTRVYEDFVNLKCVTRSLAFEYVIRTHLIAYIIENYDTWCNLSPFEVTQEIINYIKSKGEQI